VCLPFNDKSSKRNLSLLEKKREKLISREKKGTVKEYFYINFFRQEDKFRDNLGRIKNSSHCKCFQTKQKKTATKMRKKEFMKFFS
jgi:hypothetical protein